MSKGKSLFSDLKDLKEARSLVGQLRPGDGVDPRYEARRRKRDEQDNRLGQAHGEHRHEQLLCQVREAIESALQLAATPILNLLAVSEVVQDGGSVLVILEPMNPEGTFDLPAAVKAVDKASSMLVREVASTITRKDVPHLKFMVLPAGARKMEE